MQAGCTHATPGATLPPGTILDHPEAWQLVRTGAAKPADEECRIKAGLTDEQMKDHQRRHEADILGITEEDRPDFFAGLMAGYNPDGSKKPGPNYEEEEDEYNDGEDVDYNDDLSLLEE
jgi:hypothetical protein